MGRGLNLIGERFNRLTVISYAGTIGTSRQKETTWNCICDCGNKVTVRGGGLRGRKTLSCGCLGKERRLEANTSHGMKHTSTYNTWCRMKGRCTNLNDKDYTYYGGRGITVCERWLKFENFFEDMGEKPTGLTLERTDNNNGYSPENCIYASRKEQSRNKRNNRIIIYQGKTQCMKDWAIDLGIKYHTLLRRLNKYPVEIAFNMPQRSCIALTGI